MKLEIIWKDWHPTLLGKRAAKETIFDEEAMAFAFGPEEIASSEPNKGTRVVKRFFRTKTIEDAITVNDIVVANLASKANSLMDIRELVSARLVADGDEEDHLLTGLNALLTSRNEDLAIIAGLESRISRSRQVIQDVIVSLKKSKKILPDKRMGRSRQRLELLITGKGLLSDFYRNEKGYPD